YGDIASHPDWQVFDETGGGLACMAPPSGAQTTPSTWEGYCTSAAPRVGLGSPEWMLVLPNVSEEVCRQINVLLGYAPDAAIPADVSPGCVSAAPANRFNGGACATGGDINDMGTTGYIMPAYQACVSCGSAYHYYSTLIER